MVNEKVDVLNVNNAERFTTYAISAQRNSGEIKINGAAARKVQIGDPVIIIAYGSLPLDQAKNFQPKILLLNNDNKIVNDPTHDHINHFLNLKNLNIFYFKKLSAYDFLIVFLF